MHKLAFLFAASSAALVAAQVSAQATAPVQEATPTASPAAEAQNAPGSASAGVEEIIVTAQKRSETANRVGMTISALPATQITTKGIASPGDLVKLVPGFVFVQAPRGTPVFSVRGIGFDDSTLGSASTVATYMDEVPLSYPMEARFATLDVERVEVLKGPQGILFGQNSTAGAINFIAAKPTDTFTAGFDGRYGRFNDAWAQAFVSGPITDTLKIRVSGMGERSKGWQHSYVRDDDLGAKRTFAGRLIADWEPTDRFKLRLMVNGWRDKSDTQAAQLLAAFALIPTSPSVAYNTYPLPPHTSRAADWDPNPREPLRYNDSFVQASLRGDYKLTDTITATSITAWTRYDQSFAIDADGTALQDFLIADGPSHIYSFNQELRVAGEEGRLRWLVGGNYSRDLTYEENRYYLKDSSVFYGFLGNFQSGAYLRQPIRDYAVFGNLDYKLTDTITLHGGVRYTRDQRSYTGCTRDYGDGSQAAIFNIILGLNGTPNQIPPGGCTQSLRGIPTLSQFQMDQDNVSWRAAVDWQVSPTTLIYANVSKGYKSGSYPSINVSDTNQLRGVDQESVLAYEAGAKLGLFNRHAQLNFAGFYNDYSDKQLRGRILDPLGVFGIEDVLQNVPKSRVWGGEVQLQVAPTTGLTLNGGVTYVNTKVTKDFFGYDPVGNFFNYKGLQFPHTPKWNITGSADYNFPISGNLNMFVGANAVYSSKTMSLFADKSLIGRALLDPVLKPGVHVDPNSFDVKAYTLVDAQVGVADPHGKWRAWLWGKNIFNTYYWTNATQSFDSIYRLTGMPATYGIAVSFRM